MSNTLMYIICSLIWGTTWLAVHYQIGNVHPSWSICYRFSLAALILFIYCYYSNRILSLNKKQHIFTAIQGIATNCVNFIFFYYGSMFIVSGLVAVASATIMVMNIINHKLVLNKSINLRLVFGASIGLIGVITVFSGEIMQIDFNDEVTRTNLIVGLVSCIIASYCASFGQMVCIYNTKNLSVPIIQGTAFAMMYGAITAALFAISIGAPLIIDFSIHYITSLFYLSILGSVIAFVMYFQLQSNIGPVKAGYVFVLIPSMALILSYLVEDFSINIYIYYGISLIILGNIIVLGSPNLISQIIFMPINLTYNRIKQIMH